MEPVTETDSGLMGCVRFSEGDLLARSITIGSAVTLHNDGRVEVHTGYDTTEAARQFWDGVRRLVPALFPNTATPAQQALALLESVEGYGWTLAKGRVAADEPMFGALLLQLDGDGVAIDANHSVIAESSCPLDAARTVVAAAELAAKGERHTFFADRPKNYVIWSNEHEAWWRANRNGYAWSIKEAGLYTKQEAAEIVAGATFRQWGDAQPPHELPVCIDDLPDDARAQLASANK